MALPLNTLTNSLATVATTGNFADLSGTDNIQGESAYDVWLAEGNLGTEADFLTSLVGDTGPQGAAGADGGPLPALSGLDNAGAVPFFDGTEWQTVKPNSTFGNTSVSLKMCEGNPRWGPCVKIQGNNFYMED